MNENVQGGLTHLDFGDPENRERLEHVFRYAQVGRCVNGVTHDINNHLGAAMAYAELALMDEGVSEETQQTLEKVLTAIDKCGKLVSTLTGVARPMSDNTNMVDLNTLVRGVLLLREYAFRVAKVEVTATLAESLPSAVADGPKVQLALLYILLNVEEYFVSTQTKGTVAVRSYREGNGLFVEIKHSGDTIPENITATMFEPYTTNKTNNNLGMGLALARSMVRTQNGDLTYGPDHGFVLRLPVPGT
jgi:C4-dicarboxylate-specific signal transduction histidine kinase